MFFFFLFFWNVQKSQDRGKEDFSKSVDAFNWSFIKFGGSVFISELWSLEKSISYSLQCWNFCWSSSPLGFCSLRAAGTAQGGLSQPPHCACDIRCVGHNQNTWEVTEISNTCLLLYLLIISIMVFIFFNDAFWKKIFPWIKSDIFERKLGGEKKKTNKQILLLATITNTLLSVLMQGDYMKVWNKDLSLALSTALSWLS